MKNKPPKLPSDDILAVWNRIMRYQVDFSFPLELPFYFSLGAWHEAKDVVDLGSGNGYYLGRLATYFPDKCYTGIDFDERAINEARTGTDGSRFKFEVANVLNYVGEFPVGIARLLVQHLDSSEALFIAARNFLKQDGRLIVIDSNDAARLFWPAETYGHINDFFQAFSEFQRGRRHSDGMMQISKQHGFENEKSQLLLIPSSLPTCKDILHQSYRLVFEIVREHYRMPFDYDRLTRELGAWVKDEGSYSQIGVNLSSYRLVGQE